MKLRDILDRVETVADDQVIFAGKPWSDDSEAILRPLQLDEPRSVSEKRTGLSYFLEVSVALEVLEVFDDRTPTTEQRRALLIHYAEFDAYPQWVYET